MGEEAFAIVLSRIEYIQRHVGGGGVAIHSKMNRVKISYLHVNIRRVNTSCRWRMILPYDYTHAVRHLMTN
jgi:hypothetical protein